MGDVAPHRMLVVIYRVSVYSVITASGPWSQNFAERYAPRASANAGPHSRTGVCLSKTPVVDARLASQPEGENGTLRQSWQKSAILGRDRRADHLNAGRSHLHGRHSRKFKFKVRRRPRTAAEGGDRASSN